MANAKIYAGGCHFWNVRFAATMKLAEVLECNCSICSKTGSLLTFVPPEQFALLSGEDRPSDYQFGSKSIPNRSRLRLARWSFF